MDTIISSEESVEVTKFMISSIFNSIAYIREFFPEECFKDSKTENGLKMKDILRGQSVEVDRYIDWIQLGCFDALERKFLRCVKMAIYEDPNIPERIIESYEIMISYPNSPEHMNGTQINGMDESMKNKLSIHIPCNGYTNEQKVITENHQVSYTNQCVKVLRLLCIMIQTLNDLPEKKYISMEIFYWDDLTPKNYEPPLFSSPIFDYNLYFQNPKTNYKHSFGSVGSGSHRLSLALETTFSELQPLATKEIESVETKKTIIIQADELTEQPQTLQIQSTSDSQSAPVSQLNIPPSEKPKKKLEEKIKVKCLCKDSESDLDMIQCDNCRSWIHTPCAGFCTNNDKRIPNVFNCHSCEFKGNQKFLSNIRNLALMRRSISLIYSEGWVNLTEMSKRLSCSRQLAWKILLKMEKEGFITRNIEGNYIDHIPPPPSTSAAAAAESKVLSASQDSILSFKFIINRTQKVKERIKYFFSLDLSVFPELQVFFPLSKRGKKNSNTITKGMRGRRRKEECLLLKEKKSITTEKVSCNGYQ